jgi:hypothetical protein
MRAADPPEREMAAFAEPAAPGTDPVPCRGTCGDEWDLP